MRIHELELENIASLKGSHHINFDYIGQQSSLFAITGKTGAGKSSLLNAISLALYGDVYKKDSQNNDFVTLGEAHGEIKLTFSVGHQKYQAFWQMKLKKKNGEYLKKPQLIRSLSIKRENNYEAIDKSIEDLIHLNFNQFCKTSILNQGEFAKFLTSSFNERKSILEKFYDGVDLEQINVKLREKIKINREGLEEKNNLILGIKQAIKDIKISNEQIEAEGKKTQKLKNIHQHLNHLHPILVDLSKQYLTICDNHKRKNDLLEKQVQSQKAYNELKKANDSLQKDFDNKEATLKTRKPVLETCINKQFEYNKNQEQKEHYLEQKENYLNEKKKAAQKLKELNEDIEQFEKNLTELINENPKLRNMNLSQLITDISGFKSLHEKIMDFNRRIEIQEQKSTDIDKQIHLNNEELQQLKGEQVSQSIEDLDKKLLAENLKQNRLNQLLSTIKENTSETHKLKKEADRLAESLNQTEQKLAELNGHINKCQELMRLQENTISLYSLQLSVHQCLESSISQGNCVVCGSDIRNLNLSTRPVEEKELTSAQTELAKLSEELNGYQHGQQQQKIEIITLKSEHNRIKDKISELGAQSLMEWNQFSELPLSQNILNSNSYAPVEKLIQDSLKKSDKLNKLKTKIQLDQQKSLTLINKIKEYQGSVDELKVDIKNLKNQNTLAMQNYKTIINSYALPEHSDFEQNLALLSQTRSSVEKVQQLTTDISELKKDKLRQTEVQINADTKAKQITEHIQKIIDINIELEGFIKQNADKEISPKDELKQIETQYEEASRRLQSNKDALSQEKIAMAEARSKIESCEEQIRSATIMIKSHQKALTENMGAEQKSYFLNLEQFDNVPSLIDKFIQFDPEDLKLKTIIEASLEQFNQFQDRAKELFQNADRQLTEHKTLFKQKTDGEKQIANIQSQADVITQEKLKLDNLYDLLGKDEFRNYILSIIESTLIEQTNKELSTLCNGRYSLCQSNKTNRLITEFKIIDHFSDSMVRKISTLSGGETFLVSLAMALALAELTRGQTQLDSLFIDEGFGTLDHETIDEVYELLLNIQHSGKQIGIISHVKELTSRISININLEKNMSGSSQIQIINN